MPATPTPPRKGIALFALIVLQALCAMFFLSDALTDLANEGAAALHDIHLLVESLAAFAMILAIVIEARNLARLLRREAHLMRGMTIASGALHDLMEGYFAQWGLTPSEQDVAAFVIKGIETAEIARLRGSAEGTVKAHLNAIYRKAGVSGRAALVSMLIEDLMGQPLIRDRPQGMETEPPQTATGG